MNNLKSFFDYLEVSEIQLDKEEFDFQFNSHPDYPSLLALSDTMSFFNINNLALKVDTSKIELLPQNFLANLNCNGSSALSFIETTDKGYFYTSKDTKKTFVSKKGLTAIWEGIVLLADGNDNIITEKPTQNINYFLGSGLLFLFALIVWQTPSSLQEQLFYIFPLFGIMMSLGTSKTIFKSDNAIIEKFCKEAANSDCHNVVNSTKWKLLEKVNFSDLSIVFFGVQIIGLLVLGIMGNTVDYFAIQMILLVFSSPVIALSIYYQKFVEKKWCPICLSIIAVLVLEFLYTSALVMQSFVYPNSFPILVFLFLGIGLAIIWHSLKTFFNKYNDLKKSQIKANQFKRNYPVFKNTLVSTPRQSVLNPFVLFGNNKAKLRLDIITSPFCRFCKTPHYVLANILNKHRDHIAINIIYNVDLSHNANEKQKSMVKNLIHIKLMQGDAAYFKALDEWYSTEDLKAWLNQYGSDVNSDQVDTILSVQNQWCIDNNFHFTPCLFINGFQFPGAYDISDLPFFINEIMDDDKI